MKKILSLVLAAAITMSFAAVGLSAEAVEAPATKDPAKKVFVGDVNSDGKVGDVDAVMLARYYANWKRVVIDMDAADIDRNGKIEDLDVTMLMRYIANWKLDTYIETDYLYPEAKAELTGSQSIQLGGSSDISVTYSENKNNSKCGDPAVNYIFTSSDTSIVDIEGNTLKAKKMGSVVISVEVSAYYSDIDYVATDIATLDVNVTDSSEKMNVTKNSSSDYSVVASADSSFIDFFVNNIKDKSGAALTVKTSSDPASDKEIIIGTEDSVLGLNISTSDLRGGGYRIKKVGDKIGVVGKDSEGVDKAVRYLIKNYFDEKGDFVIPSNLDITDGQGQYIKKLTIAGNPISEYFIYIPDKSSESVNFAAAELQKYIERSTGDKLPIITEAVDGAKLINLVLDDKGILGDEGFIIKTEDGNLSIIGGVKRGNMYGVSEFLEKYLGWRFMGEDLLVMNERDVLDIPNGIFDKQVPVLEYRDAHGYQFRNGSDLTRMYTSKRKVNAQEDRSSINTAQYGYALGTTWYHAHSFGYQITKYYTDSYGFTEDGRVPEGIHKTQPCLVDEANYFECLESISELLDQRIEGGGKIGEELTQISVAWNDNIAYCRKSECRKVNDEEGGVHGVGSGTYVRFLNRIAPAITANYPGMKIFGIVYGNNYMRTPTKSSVADDVIMCYCWNGCNNHTFGGGECGDNTTELKTSNVIDTEFFKGWAKKTETMYSWYYCSNYAWYLAPLPIISNVLPDIQHLADMSCKGVYAESRSGDNANSFEPLTLYLISQAEWNPYMSTKKYNQLKDEYLQKAYGDGWKEINEYIALWEKAGDLMGCWLTNYDQPQNMISVDFYAENYTKMCELFDAAEAKASTTEQQYLIEKMRVHMEFIALSGLYKSMYLEGTEAQKAEYTERYEALYNSVNNLDVTIATDDKYGKLPETTKINGSPMKMWYDIGVDGDVK